MFAFVLILILSVITLLAYMLLKKMGLLNRTVRIVLPVLFISILFLFFGQTCDTDSKNLGCDFIYSSEHKHITGKIDIPPTIISYDYDKHFIIAKQKPKEFDEAIYDKMKYVYPLGRDTVYYWLIVKQEQKVFGPLDYDSFQKLKKEYNVPDKLVLK
jgi:hypothetical protein